MRIFSYHLLDTTPTTTLKAWWKPLNKKRIAGLRHAECLSAMTLGSPIVSSARWQLHTLAFFAYWEDESKLEAFLQQETLGQSLAKGWHVRLCFLRQWGYFSSINELPTNDETTDPRNPVVAVTLARLKLSELGRFIRWGKPVEELVRDHPGKTLALAAIRPPFIFSTFSIWHSQQAMTDMVHGRGSASGAQRHANAMLEQDRRAFHRQFITLRFRALSEHGSWQGRSEFLPKGPLEEL